MTNRELIEHLRTMPLDAVVVIDMFSDCQELDMEEVTEMRLLKKGQSFIQFHERWHPPGKPLPELTTVVYFPGN